MENAVLKTRFLKDKEVIFLTKDVYDFPDLIYVGGKVWKKQRVRVVEVGRQFAGVLVAYQFGGWVKLGPVAILKKYHGRGLGKMLMEWAVKKYDNKNLFVTSTNPQIKKIAIGYGFKKVPGFFHLPLSVKIFLLGQLFDYLGIKNITEAVRKKFMAPRDKRSYFIRYSP